MASIIAEASFSTEERFSSLPCSVRDIKATGLPFWLREADTATEEASDSTVKGRSSSIACRVASHKHFFKSLKADRASGVSGKV